MEIITAGHLDHLFQPGSHRTELTPEQKLAWSMIVLLIQDLHLEKHFKGIKKHYVIQRSKTKKKDHILSALRFLHAQDEYTFSFVSCCEYLNLDPTLLRKKIISVLPKAPATVRNTYRHWKAHEAR